MSASSVGIGFGGCFVLIAGVILAISVFILVRSVRSARRSAELKRVGVRVPGTVVNNQMESRTSSSTMPDAAGIPQQTMTGRYFVFRPVVKFHSLAGTEFIAVAGNVSRRSFVAGTQVPLIYHPDRPSDVQIEGGPGAGSVAAVVVSGIITTIMAAIIVVAVVVFLMFHRNGTGSGDCPPDFPRGISCSTN